MTWRIRNPRVVLGLLTALNLLNYVDRFVLPAVIAPIQEEFHLSKFVAGLPAAIFLVGYSATSPIFGTRGDRASPAGRNRMIALGVAAWSAATVGSGLATGAKWLLASRAVIGVGEASYATLSPKLIDEMAPPEKGARWMSLFSAATPIGAALGFLLGGAILHARGWRAAFFVAGGPGLLAALLCLFIETPADGGSRLASSDAPVSRRPSPSPGQLAPTAPAASPWTDLMAKASALARVGLYRRMVLGYGAFTFALGGFAYWAPAYPHMRFGMEAGKASMLVGAVTVIGGIAGTLLGGWFGERAVGAELRRAAEAGSLDEACRDAAIARANIRVCFWAGALGAPFAVLAIAAPSPRVFFVFLLLCEVCAFLLSGPSNVAILRSAPVAMRASAMALAIFSIHLLGDLWSPPLIGLAADHAPLPVAMAAVPIMFAVAAMTWHRAGSRSVGLT